MGKAPIGTCRSRPFPRAGSFSSGLRRAQIEQGFAPRRNARRCLVVCGLDLKVLFFREHPGGDEFGGQRDLLALRRTAGGLGLRPEGIGVGGW